MIKIIIIIGTIITIMITILITIITIMTLFLRSYCDLLSNLN